MKISKKYFLIDTFSNGVYFGSKFIFNLIVYSLLINAFEIEQYGIYIFFATLLGQFEFIQSGFATSLLRFIPIYKDKKEIINLVGIVSLVYLFFGIVFSLIIGALSYLNVFNFFGFNNSWEYVKYLICFAPLVWFFKTFSIALKGSKDFRMENLINMIFLILELMIIFLMIKYNYALSDILFLVFFILLLKHLFHFFFYYSRHGFKFKLIDFYSLKNQFLKVKNFSFWNFISAFSGSIINQFDRVLVAIFLGPAALTIYYGISQFLKFYTSVLGVFNSSVIPYFSEKITFSNNKVFNETAVKGTALMGAGNYTYRKEWRNQGKGSFLTHSSALRLLVHPLFNGDSNQSKENPVLTFKELTIEHDQESILIKGKIDTIIPTLAMIAYNDKENKGQRGYMVNNNYDATSWTSVISPKNEFKIRIMDLRDGNHQIRLTSVHPNGATTTKRMHYSRKDGVFDFSKAQQEIKNILAK